ncbi:response regulator [Chitinivibrio alkaliphilus]|uniref:Chemotaxis protein CheY n=1 Tax=Chitinivibrio alkaliphilus ACht1 TaxID=1313304 RepID=U7D9S7_9BACT|nr:response regulator [Chitinivibrio alkaliphilus]ERP39154.1 chemotaxis protein CheY [Chitinivibrio alkaliphilus ACht1]
MRTLIIEDDFSSRILMHKMLSPYGEVHVAENGREALGILKDIHVPSDWYDLICLDIMMPEMDGHTTLENIRSLEDSLSLRPGDRAKIIMTTALSDSESVVGAFKKNCDSYIVKPVERAKLLKQLRKLSLL